MKDSSNTGSALASVPPDRYHHLGLAELARNHCLDWRAEAIEHISLHSRTPRYEREAVAGARRFRTGAAKDVGCAGAIKPSG